MALPEGKAMMPTYVTVTRVLPSVEDSVPWLAVCWR